MKMMWMLVVVALPQAGWASDAPQFTAATPGMGVLGHGLEITSQGRSPTMITPQLQAMVRSAVQDASRRTQRSAASLEVVLAEPVTWPDGSLGCPRPGMGYTQALVPGFRIRVQAGSETLEYHAGIRGEPFYCPPERIGAPTGDPRI